MIKIFEETDLHPIMAETHDHPVYCHNVESNPDSNPWYHDMKAFLKDGSYPELVNAACRKENRSTIPF